MPTYVPRQIFQRDGYQAVPELLWDSGKRLVGLLHTIYCALVLMTSRVEG